MDPRTAAPRIPEPDAVEFVRFCYRRRRVGWPELYDEMCAVAGRGLYRGYSADDLAALGIGFSLFDMPALASLARGVVAEEQALRRPVTVTIAPVVDEAADVTGHAIVVEEPAANLALDRSGPPPEPALPTPALRFVPTVSPA